ncbi:MAG: hypothetical protein HC834_01005 [Rhodospirillales bacterium]|nr:hypothetical protein [Rhodospirillales bacterium]
MLQLFSSGKARAAMLPPQTIVEANGWQVIDRAYDVQASFPLTVVVVNQSAFYALDETSQRALLNSAVSLQNDAWSKSVDKRNKSVDLLDNMDLTLQPSPAPLQTGLRQAAARAINAWLETSGPEGAEIVNRFGWTAQ